VSYTCDKHRSPVLTRGGICVPPTVTYLPYRVSGSTLTAVGRFQFRCPGTHSRIFSGIQRAAQIVVGVYLTRTCSRVTSASSAGGVLNDYALYKSTHSLTHSVDVGRAWYRHGRLPESTPAGAWRLRVELGRQQCPVRVSTWLRRRRRRQHQLSTWSMDVAAASLSQSVVH